MTIIREKFNIESIGFGDIVEILPKINDIVKVSNVKDGLINIYINSSLCALFAGESDDLRRFCDMFDKMIKPFENNLDIEFYDLALKYKAYFFKNTLTLPVENSNILIDNQDSIYFVDFENNRKTKEIIVSVV